MLNLYNIKIHVPKFNDFWTLTLFAKWLYAEIKYHLDAIVGKTFQCMVVSLNMSLAITKQLHTNYFEKMVTTALEHSSFDSSIINYISQ